MTHRENIISILQDSPFKQLTLQALQKYTGIEMRLLGATLTDLHEDKKVGRFKNGKLAVYFLISTT